MKIKFEYFNNKLIEVDADIEALYIKNNGDEFYWFNNFKKVFLFSNKLFIQMLEHWVNIRFSKHTTSSYSIFETLKSIPADFFVPFGGDLKPKKKYLCALSETGVEFMQLLDSLIIVDEEFVEGWFRDYLTFLKEVK